MTHQTKHAVVDLGGLLLSKATTKSPLSYNSSVAMACGVGIALALGSAPDAVEESLLSREAATMFSLTAASGWGLNQTAMSEIVRGFSNDWKSVMDFAGVICCMFPSSDVELLAEREAFLTSPVALQAQQGQPPVFVTAHSLVDLHLLVNEKRG